MNFCQAGASCFIAAPCRIGRIACQNGSGGRLVEVCQDVGAQPAGTVCGPSMVCDPLGACVPCNEGSACDIGRTCATGRISCTTGAPVCELGTSLPPGTTCGGNPGTYVRTPSSPLSWIDACALPGHQVLLVGSDDGTAADTLPFTFDFYGASFTSVEVSSNGLLSFPTTTWQATNSPLPTTAVNNTVFAFWDDLIQRSGVCTGVAGTAPNRQYVVEWNDSYFYPSGGPDAAATHLTFEAILSETSNTVDVLYRRMDGVDSRATGAESTVGFQRDNGTSYDEVGYNTAGVATAGTSYRWTPGVTAVCNGTGDCVACVPGAACALADECGIGALSCTGGAATCVRVGTRPAGYDCATGSVCNRLGVCTPCARGATCDTGNVCTRGAIVCDSGDPVCTVTSTVTPGTTCGLDQVCNRTGACIVCHAGAACTPSNACHTAQIVCSSGDPVCTDTGVVPPNTTCTPTSGGAGYCDHAGDCQPCGTPEVCDGLDNDCNGAIDDGTPARTCGVGACLRSVACTMGAYPTCVPGAPGVETCNNVDDNCDGVVDLVTRSCYSGPGGTQGVGACRAGVGTCTAGVWGSCVGEVNPSAEVCNGVDDNCDSIVDDGLSTPCYTGPTGTQGVGVCRSGTTSCASGGWTLCVGQITPSTEICNGRDDNCDGAIDEGIGSITCGVGSCQNTVPGCVGGVAQTCTPLGATPETCNGVDDDCNGVIDDGVVQGCYTGPTGTQGVGVCRGGTQACSAGTWGACTGQVLPNVELCNSVDDNCDGSIDEGFTSGTLGPSLPPSSTPRVLIYGPTHYNERDYLPAGAVVTIATESMWRSMTRAQFANFHLIVLGDTDCSGPTASQLQAAFDTRAVWGGAVNGRVVVTGMDAGCHAPSVTGAANALRAQLQWAANGGGTGLYVTSDWARRGLDYLSALGSFSEVPQDAEGVHVLDTLHPTMLGSSDASLSNWGNSYHSYFTSFPSTFTAVAEVAGSSPSHALTLVRGVAAAMTVCPVGGSCSSGTGACARAGMCVCSPDGTSTVCNATGGMASTEVCNNIDDDCNGLVDDMVTRGCYAGPSGTDGVGICRAGTQTCGGGVWGSCAGQVLPAGETCNGFDDDCNGAVDEGVTQACYSGTSGTAGVGICRAGAQACVSGAWATACTGEVLPATESCNGVDDNCDGTVDDPFTRLPPSATPRVLVYGPTDYNESAHVPSGSIVTVATESQWRSMTAAQFGSYNLIVIGDKNCSGPTVTDLQALYDTRNVWGRAINGRVVVTGMDAGCHAPSLTGADTVLRAQLQWAANGGGTGLYASTDWARRGLDYLSALGSFSEVSQDAESVHVLDTLHPTMLGSSDASLSNWGNSYHSYFTSYPSSFTAVAEISGVTPSRALALIRGAVGAGSAPGTLGAPCTAGLGACSRTGTYVCTADGTGIECNASAGSATPEVCNGIDDDCNGTVDDITPTACSPGACATGVRACRAGIPAGTLGVSSEAPICQRTAFVAAGTTCRASAGVCDVAEVCDGASDACPVDGFLSSATVCRASTDLCDAAERCTGSSPACPTDGMTSSGTVCRASTGSCDPAETCNGVLGGCPADVLAPAGTECRAAASACDVAEACTGSSSLCPTDAFSAAGTVCRSAGGPCDVAETCSGSTNSCPADAFVSAGTTCRGAAGVCDSAEACTGSGAGCPADGFLSSATVCRAAVDVCDAAERCTGGGASCPADALEPSSTVCRPSSTLASCDPPEYCTGSAVACPSDVVTQPPTAELCNGLDDDCNGIIDDPFTRLQPSATPRVLVYGPTHYNESSRLPSGAIVTVATESMWRSMTAAQFATYNLIVIGDKSCSGPTAADLQAAYDTRAVWGSAINGRVVVTGMDAGCHAPSLPGADTLLRAQLQWAANGGGTGLYASSDWAHRGYDYLSALGSFSEVSQDAEGVHVIDALHPTMLGSSDASLSNWGNSYHAYFTSFPSTFTAITEISGVTPSRPLTLVRVPMGAGAGGGVLGGACTVGTGGCSRPGNYVCTADGTGVECRADPSMTTPEVCNGLDDDCDGAVDNVPPTACSLGVCSTAQTGCRAGITPGTLGVASESPICQRSGFLPSTTVCRTAIAGGCDVPETCTGSSDACPVNGFAPSTTVCRTAAGACDAPEYCNGGSAACPGDVFLPSSSVCRAAADVCDRQEVCTGSSPVCPTDTFQPSSTVCRSASGACDAVERCTGAAVACPADILQVSGTVCRAAASGCDVAEVCDGATNACPADTLVSPGSPCTSPVGGVCNAGTCVCPSGSTSCSGTCNATGASCTVGVGACARTGTVICSGATTRCSVTAGSPTTETCNGIDDNCNGVIDDGVSRSCYTGSTGSPGVGICRSGTQACSAGVWGSCSGEVLPATEICDSVDNDCNGVPDDPFYGGIPPSASPRVLIYGPGQTTESTLVPAGAVVTVASEAMWRSMTTAQFSTYNLLITGNNCTATTCRAIYDTRAVWGAAITGRVLVETSHAINHGLLNGPRVWVRWILASGGTGLFVSDDLAARRLDFMSPFGTFTDVSTGFTAGNIVAPTHPAMIGVRNSDITMGSNHAMLTAWPPAFTVLARPGPYPSNAMVVAREAITSGLPTGLGQSCTVGHSECASNGVYVCSADGSGTVCNAVLNSGGTVPCYTGPTDTAGVGICRSGTTTCTDGFPGACTGDTTPGSELCNGIDDDCDGTVDDPYQPDTFQIGSLSASGCATVEHNGITGDDKNGIAVSSRRVFYSGDSATGRFELNLTGATVNRVYEFLTGDIHMGQVFSLGSDATTPLAGIAVGGTGTVQTLLALDGATGDLTGGVITLSTPITVHYGFGVFAGWNRVVLHDAVTNVVYNIDLLTSAVTTLGTWPMPTHTACEAGSYWGVAEYFGGDVYLTYVQSSTAVVRLNTTTGAITTLGTFSNLGDMCTFAVSKSNNRWYFHHEGSSQFRSSTASPADEWTGYCPLTWSSPVSSAGGGLGVTCTVGVGACARTGTYVCSASGTSTFCPATPGSPGTETCNGLDDDCDGLTDEGFCRVGGVCYTDGQLNPSNNCQYCAVPSATVSGPTTWSPVAAGTTCRGAAGVCDVAEVCSGTGAACPSNSFLSSATVCRGAAGTCDRQETCTGSSAACPADTFQPSSVVCRGASDVCDRAETCTGSSTVCPGDSLQPSGTVCRPSASACDAQETCTGLLAACPSDVASASGTVCRAAVGVCDVAETCDGSSMLCPVDGYSPSGTVCRASISVCDVTESCTGASNACPGDGFAPSSTVCRPTTSTQTCDPAENCTGSSASCPGNVVVRTPSPEICNSIDDDCNGIVDDPFLTGPGALGVPCTVGAGACARTGVRICIADGSTTTCSVTQAAALTEVCNGIDDDCNGVVDDVTPTSCSLGACSTAHMACRAGITPGTAGVASESPTCQRVAYNAAGSTCRASTGACDPAEVCSGSSDACPSDALAASTVECRASAGPCDQPETCTGSSAACPANVLVAAGTTCRASAGACDPAEACTGSSAACPADNVSGVTVVCRASVGACDVAETCTGSTTACPADGYSASGTVCRGSAGACDVVETCDGAGPACPADAFSPSSAVCRAAAGVCDVAESCTGTSAACPTNAFSPSSVVCRASTSQPYCDPAESCTGSSAACPADVVTRASSAETCNGVDDDCNGVVDDPYITGPNALGTSCTVGAGACARTGMRICLADGSGTTCNVTQAGALTEVCNGIDDDCNGVVDDVPSSACSLGVCSTAATGCRAGITGGTAGVASESPICLRTAYLPSTTTCRASAGACDPAEACTGSSDACPTNALSASTVECRASAGPCDQPETCTGSSAACPGDAFVTGGTTCRASVGACDPAEACTGSSAACPADTLSGSSVVCRASVGACDPAERCTGSAPACPSDAFSVSGTTCRASAGVCDVAEVCTGSSAACPADGFVSSATVCRGASGVCDVAESCTGSSAACPADGFAASSVVCRATTNVQACDPSETCTGSSAACPADVVTRTPTTEICNSRDDDCNGVVDDPFITGPNALGTSCTVGAGACARTGMRICLADGSATTCNVTQAGALTEVCNGIDDDCNGVVDDVPSSACTLGVCSTAATGCRAGITGGTAGVASESPICLRTAYLPSTTTCRAASGACDTAETCTGSTDACPPDVFQPSTTVCRASAGVCDAPESCTGTSAACPADAFVPPSTVCRASTGVCDVAETCGGSVTYPGDSVGAGAWSHNLPCTWAFGLGTLDGHSAIDFSGAGISTSPGRWARVDFGSAQVIGAFAANAYNGTYGRGGIRDFEIQYSTDNATWSTAYTGTHPDAAGTQVYSFTPVSARYWRMVINTIYMTISTSCGNGQFQGTFQFRGGSSTPALCPTDVFQPSSTVCRASAGGCDAAETCTGTTGACPADAPTTTGSACTSPVGGVCSGFTCVCPSGSTSCGGTCAATGSSCTSGVGACARTGTLDCMSGSAGVLSLAGGESSTCAVMVDRTMRCWGWNSTGQLGNGSVTTSTTPVVVTGVTGAVRASMGFNHTCATVTGGAVRCWGNNANGQLGDGTVTQRTTSVPVSGLTNVVELAAGYSHTCALKSDGSVWCWGLNTNGQLGDGTLTQRTTPVAVSGITNAVDIAAGYYHTCAIRQNGTTWCWGLNNYGQHGNGTATSSLRPVQMPSFLGAVSLTAGEAHTCAVMNDGSVRCWGRGTEGQLGNNAATTQYSPVTVLINASTALTNVTQLDGGRYHNCARLSDSTVRCWGWNAYGQIGDNSTSNRVVAVQSLMNVTGSPTNVALAATSVTAGYYQSCAVQSTGAVRCWGRNDYGQLGDGSVYGRSVGFEVLNLTGASICTGTPGATAMETCNTIDDNCNGVVDDQGPSTCTACTLTAGSCTAGIGACARTGSAVCGVGGAISTGASEVTSCAVMGTGALRCWGYNGYGNVGDGTTTQRSAPVGAFPSTLTTVTQMAGGFEHECVRLASGQVQCWGYNAYGQLGNNTTTNSTTPVTVLVAVGTPLTNVSEISMGYNTSCALKVDGTVWCWGYNGNYEIGDGTTSTRTMAVQVSGLTGVVRIGLGHNHGCAVRSDGTLRCWGYNLNGQLGDGTTTARSTPIAVPGFTTAVEVVGGQVHTCVRLSDNTVRCFGRGTEGQLGNNAASNSLAAVTVLINSSTALTNARQLTASMYGTCARIGDGTARCWGWNNYGQVGDGTGSNRVVATVVQELRPGASSPITLASVATLSASHYHVCATLTDLTVRCWGRGDYGEIGDGGLAHRSYATEVLSLTNGVSCSATPGTGTAEVCDGVDNDCNGVVDDIAPTSCSPGVCGTGRLACSGTSTVCTVLTLSPAGTVCRASAGVCDAQETCNGSSPTCPTDVPVATGTSCSPPTGATCSGFTCSCPSGQTNCAGVCLPTGASCTVGTGSCAGTGTVVCGVSAGVQVAPGYEHTCALMNDRTVRCWGYNGYGQLGDSTSTNRTATVPVSGITTATQVAGGHLHTCARLADGTARCWGYNGYGQIGDNTTTNRTTPTPVSGLSGVRQLDAGIYHTCALLNDGTVRCWGYNGYGQVGDNTTTSRSLPTVVQGLFNVVHISTGGYTSCAVKSNGTVWCWGYNSGYGNLGDGTATDRSLPVQVVGITTATHVSVAYDHTCARLSTGSVQCWGYNAYGGLGNGTTTTSYTPVTVTGITTATGAMASSYHTTCAILADTSVRCWGYNGHGAVGNGTTTNALSPVTPTGLASGAVQVDGSVYHVCTTLSTGAIRCAGFNDYSQIGDATTTNALTPTLVNNLTGGTMCSGTTTAPSTEVCDGADNDCNGIVDDVAPASCAPGPCGAGHNACSGGVAICATDSFTTAGTVCRAAVAGGCDVQETCTGSSVACPADAVVAAGTTCRASAGVCDVAETCNGSSNSCPADTLAAAGTVCRAAVAGGCDVAEACTGSTVGCPADAVVAAGTTCRAAVAGGCDVAEVCNGTNACPGDSVRAAGTVCRPSVNQPYCDPQEVCTGSSNACPADVITRSPSTEICNSTDDNCNGVVDEGSATTCAGAINTMTFVPGNSATYTGYVPAAAGSEQWYVATFAQNADYNSHGTGTPTVNLTVGTGDASLRMEVRYGTAPAVCAVGATCGAGTSWSFVDNASIGGGSPTGAYSTRNQAWPTTVYVRLYRTTAGSAVCSNYSLTISR